jgi:hypothetical protein
MAKDFPELLKPAMAAAKVAAAQSAAPATASK